MGQAQATDVEKKLELHMRKKLRRGNLTYAIISTTEVKHFDRFLNSAFY